MRQQPKEINKVVVYDYVRPVSINISKPKEVRNKRLGVVDIKIQAWNFFLVEMASGIIRG